MMKFIIIFFCSIILPIFSLKEIKPKLCINCKYIIKNDDNRYNKCSLFLHEYQHQPQHQQQKDKINFLVTGIDEQKYYSCSMSRGYETMCGEEGKMYKKKYTRNTSNSTMPKFSIKELFD